jgi:serine/threonine protein kinase
MSSQNLWVQHQTFIDLVSTEGCSFIAQFLKEIKKEFEIPGPASQLTLYKPDGETEIDIGDSTSLFVAENSRANPLIVKTTIQHTSLIDKLKQLGITFTTKDVSYIINNDMSRLSILMSPNVTKDVAQAIIFSAKSKIKSSTQRQIGEKHLFFLGGSLNVGQGQTKSSLYYVFSESGGVLVAKVYNGHKIDFIREVEISQALDHKNLVKFIKTFSIQNETRHIIIMPFFPRSVSDMLDQHSKIGSAAIKVIARNCFDALCHLHSKGFCFADLKPSNIMLQNGVHGHAILVDYGATIPIGSPIIEFTAQYCLNANPMIATEHLDWICLGTTLAHIGGFEIFIFNSANDLVDQVNSSSQDVHLKQLIVSCLQNPSLSNITVALHNFETH